MVVREARAHELIPSARRLIESLRDMGYDFAQAVADIVDNAIEARATKVDVDVKFDGDESWVQIADNGKGMNPEDLREAMRYGYEREYEEDDLGKFGLGLKTASMSQCRSLSVASRCRTSGAEVPAYCWDLDHIEKANRWEILPVGRTGLGTSMRQPLKDKTGTVVLWQRLDRILGHSHPYGEAARKRILQMCRELEIHLAMVFHRFLAGEVPGKQLTIRLNENPLTPWDPFCRSEAKTKRLQPVRLSLEHEGTRGDVVLQPFVLPHQEDFSSAQAFHDASGPAAWNQQQGFYVYRAGRMIQSGGWSNLRAPDEHTKLTRIALSFGPSLDEAFKINVAKMRVQIPAQIREQVRQAIGPALTLARETYDRKPRRGTDRPTPPPGAGPTAAQGAGTGPQGASGDPRLHPKEPPAEELLTFEQWADRMLVAANRHERKVIRAVLSRMRSSARARQR